MKRDFRLEDFNEKHLAYFDMALNYNLEDGQIISGDKRYVGFDGIKPLCVIDTRETSFIVEPHVSWFPWASSRDKYEAFIWAMKHFSEHRKVMLIILKLHKGFFDMFAKRGILKKVGVFDGLPKQAGEEMHIYQVRECNE